MDFSKPSTPRNRRGFGVRSQSPTTSTMRNGHHGKSGDDFYHASVSRHRQRRMKTCFIMLVFSLAIGSKYLLLKSRTSSSSEGSRTNNMQIHHEGLHKPSYFEEASVSKYTTPFVIIHDWEEHIRRTIAYQEKNGVESIRKYITAYVEPWYLFNDTIPGTGSRGDMKNEKDRGTPPEFVIPLPLRSHTPEDLKRYEYENAAQTCHEMPGKFPVDRGLEIDRDTGQTIIWNIGDTPTSPDFPWEEAPYCPVEADPFLPWIHDVFPGPSQTRSKNPNDEEDKTKLRSSSIHFIAQNKRKCRTGTHFTENVNRLVPQVSLLQSVSVKRVSDEDAQLLAPNLWSPTNSNPAGQKNQQQTRYRLAPYEEADHDGMYTRFICQFHTTIYKGYGIAPQQVLLGETLSVYPFNYEMAAYRKGTHGLLSAKGKDTMLFWTSNLHFECPVPEQLQSIIASGESILPDGTPTIRLDLIPIRTSVRYNELYLTEDMIGPVKGSMPLFDPEKRWGHNNILPRIEASGRWTNIPICLPPQEPPPPPSNTHGDIISEEEIQENRQQQDGQRVLQEPSRQKYSSAKRHFLSACLWASSTFKTRGEKRGSDTATNDRLIEWIEFHIMVGFDHIYLYDNSGAHTNETSLQPIVDMFHPSQVTRIDWPSIICNNNVPSHDSPGERSTQYAAENSCRSRHAPFTEWIASFDTDEYFVPMGKYNNLKDFLADAGKEGTNILSLRSSRGRLRLDKSTMNPNKQQDSRNEVGGAFEKATDSLYLEAYNCDSAGYPKPSWADRARKQIYRADYVLYHFVHYSTVTKGYMSTYRNATALGTTWHRLFAESPPSERTTDELNEAVMVHTKTLTPDMLSGWQKRCQYNHTKKWQECWAAFPWPSTNSTIDADSVKTMPYDDDGFEYNCFINSKVEEYWIPRLKEALLERKEMNFLKRMNHNLKNAEDI